MRIRHLLTSSMARPEGAWIWVVVLLVLPNCALPHATRRDFTGGTPRSSVVFCDIRHSAPPDRCGVGVAVGTAEAVP